ncbi:hypothetical protein VP01_9108g1, partial [Puccinia sorghi]
QNHLSTVEAAHHSSSLQHTVNLYMEKLYKKLLPNLKYNKHLSIFILSVDGGCDTGMGSSFGINSVSLYSLPSSIKFVSLNSKKRKTNHPSGSNDMAQLLARLLGQKNEGSSTTQSESNQSSTVQWETGTMEDYLEFVKIHPEEQSAILEILDHNNIA